jgi:hypothetical protein
MKLTASRREVLKHFWKIYSEKMVVANHSQEYLD